MVARVPVPVTLTVLPMLRTFLGYRICDSVVLDMWMQVPYGLYHNSITAQPVGTSVLIDTVLPFVFRVNWYVNGSTMSTTSSLTYIWDSDMYSHTHNYMIRHHTMVHA